MQDQHAHSPNPQHVTITKCDHHGTPQISYPGEIVYADEGTVVARCVWRLQKTYRLGSFTITEDDILIEFYYQRHWFNIFAVYDPSGRRKGWYCNITYPVALRDQRIFWHDLALDLLVLPDGQRQILDYKEFAALSLSAEDRAQAQAAMLTLEHWATTHTRPFSAPWRRNEQRHDYR